MREPHVFLLPDELQLCRDKARILDKAFDFGVRYKKDCPISVENLFSDPDYATYFYDLCILYPQADVIDVVHVWSLMCLVRYGALYIIAFDIDVIRNIFADLFVIKIKVH